MRACRGCGQPAIVMDANGPICPDCADAYGYESASDAVAGTTSHTEGPWIIRTSPHYKITGVSHREIIVDPEGEEGGIVLGEVFYSDTGDDEAEANARLIAAAPELLEALQRILFEDSDKSERDRLNDRLLAHAAIAKATS